MNLADKIQKLELASTSSDASKDVIKVFCDNLGERIFGPAKSGAFLIEPGYTTNHGLEYKVATHIFKGGYRDIFFRFFVPIDGYPVMLDLWNDSLHRCDTGGDIEQALSDFLDKPEVLMRLKGYIEIAGQ